jgi:hypothetical protein
VQQPGQQDVAIVDAGGAQSGHDVQPVPPICDVHGVEQADLRRRQPGVEIGSFGPAHPRAQVAGELTDLMPPPGS